MKNIVITIIAGIAIVLAVGTLFKVDINPGEYGKGNKGVMAYCMHYAQGFQKGYDNCMSDMRYEGKLK